MKSLPSVLSGLFFGSIFTLPVTAQISPDNTTSTTVTPTPTGVEINNGDTAGGNLFHSFSEFSVPNGSEAFFNNADSISNIFSRVTGGNISNINGILRANGAANLFLINPAGILFGRDASLQIGGSFFGSTADSILFPDGEFSATDLDNPPLITINAPIGLTYRDNPAPIEVNSTASADFDPILSFDDDLFGLRVPDGKNFILAGGDITANGGGIVSVDGLIQLTTVSEQGTVEIDFDEDNPRLNLPDDLQRGNISLSNNAGFLISGADSDIAINTQNLDISEDSGLFSVVYSDLGLPDTQFGDITIDATEAVRLNNGNIFNYVGFEAIGNSGNINIKAQSLEVTNTGQIIATTLGQGDTGNVNIEAEEKVSFDGRDENDSFPSGIFVNIREGAIGNAGNINIATNSLQITNRAQLSSNTEGMGNAGNINIDATDEVVLDNSILISEVTEGLGIGDGGDITIKTGSLKLENGSALLADTENIGNAGNITIEASESVILEGEGAGAQSGSLEDGFIIPNQITATVDDFEGAMGEGGDINISTPSLTVKDDGFIRVSTFRQDNAGSLNINTDELLVKDNGFISASTFGQGNAGDLTINTKQLVLESGGELQAISFDDGNAGTLTINSIESIRVSGTASDGQSPSGIFASAFNGSGNGGNLTVATDELIVRDKGTIAVGNFQIVFGETMPLPPGSGEAGILTVNASSIQLKDEGTITAANASGRGGSLIINTDSLSLVNQGSIETSTISDTGSGGNLNLNVSDTLSLRGNSTISAQADQGANGGNIDIDTNFIIAYPSNGDGNDIVASAQQGQGGNIDITAEALLNIEERKAIENNGTNDIDASSGIEGLDGTVSIETPDTNPIRETTEVSSEVVTQEIVSATDACAAKDIDDASGLVVRGKGGLPPEPTEPFTVDTILAPEDRNLTAEEYNRVYRDVPDKDLVPARGVIVKPDGGIILTAYPTSGTPGYREYREQMGCGDS